MEGSVGSKRSIACLSSNGFVPANPTFLVASPDPRSDNSSMLSIGLSSILPLSTAG